MAAPVLLLMKQQRLRQLKISGTGGPLHHLPLALQAASTAAAAAAGSSAMKTATFVTQPYHALPIMVGLAATLQDLSLRRLQQMRLQLSPLSVLSALTALQLSSLMVAPVLAEDLDTAEELAPVVGGQQAAPDLGFVQGDDIDIDNGDGDDGDGGWMGAGGDHEVAGLHHLQASAAQLQQLQQATAAHDSEIAATLASLPQLQTLAAEWGQAQSASAGAGGNWQQVDCSAALVAMPLDQPRRVAVRGNSSCVSNGQLWLHSFTQDLDCTASSTIARQHGSSLTSLILSRCPGVNWDAVQSLAAASRLKSLCLSHLGCVTLNSVIAAIFDMQQLMQLVLDGLSASWSLRQVRECPKLSGYLAETFQASRKWTTYDSWKDGVLASCYDFWEFSIAEVDRPAILAAAPRLMVEGSTASLGQQVMTSVADHQITKAVVDEQCMDWLDDEEDDDGGGGD
eukprot:gene682-980_t